MTSVASSSGSTPPRRAHKRGHGEGSIDQLPDGRWRARLMVGTRPDGRPDRRPLYGKTRAEVQAKLAALRRRAEQGTLGTSQAERQTVATYLTRWLETARAAVRPTTAERYEQILRLHLIPELGKRRLGSLRPADVQACYARKLAGGMTPATLRKVHNVLHRALQQALRWGDVPRNVADAVEPPSVPHREVRPPAPEELQRLLATSRDANDDLAALWAVAAATGCRQGELLGLQWQDVDLPGGTLTVRRTLQAVHGGAPTFGEPKTARSRRTIRLGPDSVGVLRDHRQRQLGDRLRHGPAYAGYDLVFASRVGTPLMRRNVIRAFKMALRRAGLPESVRIHDLRHFAATNLLRARVDLKTTSARLGHSSIRITGDLYQHAVPELDADAAERLEAVIRGGPVAR